MKGIVLELKDLSDSREVMESRETPGISRFICILLVMILCALVFSCFFEIDEYSRVTGEIKTREATGTIIPSYTCRIKEIHVSEGQEVKNGDILFRLDADYAREQKKAIEDKLLDYKTQIENTKLLRRSIDDNINYFQNTDEDTEYYYRYEQYKNGILLAANEITDSKLNNNLTLEDKKNNLYMINQSISEKKTELSEMKTLFDCVKSDGEYYGSDALLNAGYTEYRTAYDKSKLISEQYRQVYEDAFASYNYQNTLEKVTAEQVNAAKCDMDNAYKDMNDYKDTYISDIRTQIIIIENKLKEDPENTDAKKLCEQYTNLKNALENNEQYQTDDVFVMEKYDEYTEKYSELQSEYHKKSNVYNDLNSKYSTQNKVMITETELRDFENSYKSAELDVETIKNNYISQLQTSIRTIENELKTLESNKKSLELSLKNVGDLDEYEKLSENRLKTEAIISINSEIEALENNISSAEMQLIEVDEMIESSEIRATFDGIVTLMGNYHSGDLVQSGNVLCSLVPKTDELRVMLYIPENEISKIKIGQSTEYIFDALPYTEYGKVTGKILSVSEDSVSNEFSETKFYIAYASLSKQVLENNNGEERSIKTGMLVEAKTISCSKKVIVWLAEKLNFINS